MNSSYSCLLLLSVPWDQDLTWTVIKQVGVVKGVLLYLSFFKLTKLTQRTVNKTLDFHGRSVEGEGVGVVF